MSLKERWRKLFNPKQPVIPYTTEAAHASLFIPSSKYAEVTAKKPPRLIGFTRSRADMVRLTRVERLDGYFPGVSPLSVDVSHASVECIGLPGTQLSVEIKSQADERDDARARRVLERVKVKQKNGRLRVLNPQRRKNCHCQTELAILCPPQRFVTVRGVYSYVRLADLTGGVDVETTHARISLLNVGRSVNARVQEGIIDYSGQEGSVRLFAGWEINLNFTAPVFAGEMEATSEGPVRVLLPPEFATSFEASLAKNAAFVCRADVHAQVLCREQDGHMIYSFGDGPPAIRLASLKGPIVMDNAVGPRAEAVGSAISLPHPPMLRTGLVSPLSLT